MSNSPGGFFFAEYLKNGSQIRAACFAGESDAEGEHELAGFGAIGFGGLADEFFGTRPVVERTKGFGKSGEERFGLLILGDFGERFRVDRVIRVGVEGDSFWDFGQEGNFFLNGSCKGFEVVRSVRAIDLSGSCEVCWGELEEMLLIDPRTFSGVVFGGRAIDGFEAEFFYEFIRRKDFVVIFGRPTEEG